jgi:hypothetical protein
MTLEDLRVRFEPEPPSILPSHLNGGRWDTSHVQGITVDRAGGFIYYSFTTLLVKSDFHGRIVGTVGGIGGHLGDLDFNEQDGRVYASLEYKKAGAFYIAIFDVNAITEVGMDARSSALVSTVHLDEVVDDFTAILDTGSDAPVRHRHGCSGIDGIGFGPVFGSTDGEHLLTVAYGIFADESRSDNDDQVLLQYSVRGWRQYERPLSESAPHRSGPSAPAAKFFVRTGNTTFGVQNLAFDESTGLWLLGVYAGTKPGFPNYTLFAVDAATSPRWSSPRAGASGPVLELTLAAAGLEDPATGIRGWHCKADVGVKPLGDGLFYLSTDSIVLGFQTSDVQLFRWTGSPSGPFAPVAATTSLAIRGVEVHVDVDLHRVRSRARHRVAGRTERDHPFTDIRDDL